MNEDCPLSTREQTRNLVLYGINVSLVYLAAPILYVGSNQAALFERLGQSTMVCNLPASLYFWMTPIPIIIAWYFCAVRLLRPVLIATYLATALMGAVVVAALLQPAQELVVWAVLLHSAVLGCALGTVATYQWELLARGVSESRRGLALGLAFGVGPVVAFFAFLATQPVLTRIGYPWNWAILFAVTVPAMALAALLSSKFIVPHPKQEVARRPFVAGVFGGLGEFLSKRLILIASMALVLAYAGYNILSNLTLFTRQALGEPAENYAGYQGALRFGFKAVGGLLLGWLLTRSNPKAGLIVTGTFCLASVLWVCSVSGTWFLVAFGLMGIGELLGVYYPNYIMCCSKPGQVRRNMAFVAMLSMPAGFTGLLYGALGDTLGLETSFATAIVLLCAALLLVMIGLPARPQQVDPPPAPPEVVQEEATIATTV
jgi:hypothetical protein